MRVDLAAIDLVRIDLVRIDLVKGSLSIYLGGGGVAGGAQPPRFKAPVTI